MITIRPSSNGSPYPQRALEGTPHELTMRNRSMPASSVSSQMSTSLETGTVSIEGGGVMGVYLGSTRRISTQSCASWLGICSPAMVPKSCFMLGGFGPSVGLHRYSH